MPSTLAPLSPLPVPAERLVNPQTGLMTLNWYQWFQRLADHTREIEERLDEAESRLDALETP